MSRQDTFTNTEDDAGAYDRLQAYPDDDRDYDEPTGGPVGHECTSPDPGRCLICVLVKVIAKQKVSRR